VAAVAGLEDLALVSAGGQIWTLDPASLQPLGTVRPDPGYATDSWLQLLPLGDRRALVAGRGHSTSHAAWVLDLADATAPRVVAQLDLDLALGGRLAVDGHLVVTVGTVERDGAVRRLRAFDLGDPARPKLLGEAGLRHCCSAVALTQGYVLAGGDGGLDIVDLRDPSAPRLLGAVPGLDNVRQLSAEGRLAYVLAQAGATFGLHVLDLTDPSSPRLLGGQSTALHPADLLLLPPVALVAARDRGLEVLDVADPDRLRRLAELPAASQALDIARLGERVLLADDGAGLWAFEAARLPALRTVWGPGD
jgi:hypothetical protein